MPRVLAVPHELQLIIASYCDDAPTRARLALTHPSWTSAAEYVLYESIRINNLDVFGSPNFLSFCYAVTHNERKAQRVRALRITKIGFQALADQFCALLELLPRLQYLHVPILGPTALQRLTDFLQSEASLPHLWMISADVDIIPDPLFPMTIDARSKMDVQRARFRDAILARSASSFPLRVIFLKDHSTLSPGDRVLRRIRTLARSLSVITSQGFSDIALWPCVYAERRRREAYFQDCRDALRRSQTPLSAPPELEACLTLESRVTSSQFSDLGALFAETTPVLQDLHYIRIAIESMGGSGNLQTIPDATTILATLQPTMRVLRDLSFRFCPGGSNITPDKATLVQIAQALVNEGCHLLERLQGGSAAVWRTRDEGGEFGGWG